MTTTAPEVDLWTRGTGAYDTYRIPALAVAASGTILAFCEGRRDGGGDAGQIDLLLRRSHDGGRTWDEVAVVNAEAGYTNGNPAPVVDQRTGTVVLTFTRNPAEHGETDVCAGLAQRTVWVTRSTDDGVTWSEPAEITAQAKEESWTWYATGPGHGLCLQSGRLVIPCDHITGVHMDRWADPYHAHVIYSDDGGHSWSIGGSLPDGTNESTAAELRDGRLYLNARSYRTGKRRVQGYSDDGGQSFAQVGAHEALIEPECQGSVLAGRDGVLFFANPASTDRERLTIRHSRDDGVTWSSGTLVTEGPAAYNDLALTADGDLLCLYEGGSERPYEHLRLVRFAVAELLAGGEGAHDG